MTLAGQLEDAFAAIEHGDHATYLRLLHLLADEGNPNGQFNLGLAYYNGQGVRQDFAQAMKWLRKAADQGVAGAQFILGDMYAYGQGVPQA